MLSGDELYDDEITSGISDLDVMGRWDDEDFLADTISGGANVIED